MASRERADGDGDDRRVALPFFGDVFAQDSHRHPDSFFKRTRGAGTASIYLSFFHCGEQGVK